MVVSLYLEMKGTLHLRLFKDAISSLREEKLTMAMSEPAGKEYKQELQMGILLRLFLSLERSLNALTS